MASHVVVIDSTARRHTIKTTPGMHMSDVLQTACSKLRLNSDNYTLKHNNKQVDLSRAVRHSGLTSGAKLDLIQASRSPAVVSVALQVPSSESAGESVRLTDKVPSTTSLWQILRRFESGVAGTPEGSRPNYNFTQRATQQMNSGGTTGAGRLCYEMPVINVMSKELGSFVDLQKTLLQLGLNSGSALLRLSFRSTEQSMHEAMEEISQYFRASEEPQSTTTGSHGAHASALGELASVPDVDSCTPLESIASEPLLEEDVFTEETPAPEDPTGGPASNSDGANADSSSEPTISTTSDISIYKPPSSHTPAAVLAAASYNEDDYIPTIAHAQVHQKRLNASGRNTRLLSDHEMEVQKQARAAALSDIEEVTVMLRFPDQSRALKTFVRGATVGDVYGVCRELMERKNDEEFGLRVLNDRGAIMALQEGADRLIEDLMWKGRVMVTVVWCANVDSKARAGPVLKQKYQEKAQDLKVDVPVADAQMDDREDEAPQKVEETRKSGGGDKESRMKSFLKLSKK